jgi:hypothetical protein
LSGSVAGDHVSPISETTVLSSMSCECNLTSHVMTQGPYSLLIVFISIVLGTIPLGYGAWPNYAGLILGFLVILVIVYFFGKPILSDTGSYDILTELIQKLKKQDDLEVLRMDTVKAFSAAKDPLDETTELVKPEELEVELDADADYTAAKPVEEAQPLMEEEVPAGDGASTPV